MVISLFLILVLLILIGSIGNSHPFSPTTNYVVSFRNSNDPNLTVSLSSFDSKQKANVFFYQIAPGQYQVVGPKGFKVIGSPYILMTPQSNILIVLENGEKKRIYIRVRT